MIKTTVNLTSLNERFWHALPRGVRGKVLNYLFDRLREDLGNTPDRQTLSEYLGKVFAKGVKN